MTRIVIGTMKVFTGIDEKMEVEEVEEDSLTTIYTTFRPLYKSYLEFIIYFGVIFRVFTDLDTFWIALVIQELFGVKNYADASEV